MKNLFILAALVLAMPVSGQQHPDHVMPQLGCWFWGADVLKEDGYKKYIDQVSVHTPWEVLTTSFRFPDYEATDELVHRQVKLATEYARRKGITLAVDLDVRLARRAFMDKYPDEMQEMLILEEIDLNRKKEKEVVIKSRFLTDHYTGRTEPYLSLKGRVQRVYSYEKSPEGIDASTLKDITDECTVKICSKDSIVLSVPGIKGKKERSACVMVSFTHLSPDVFAPHLKSFQRELIESYSDIPMAGVCKDEWGFPPCFYETFTEFWYSDKHALAYKEWTGGRELLEDCLLMSLGIKGKEKERILAINHLRELSRQRNADLEDDFYLSVKEIFGPDAIVATHPTWYPFPGFQEYKKNGLSWWAATRDWAQTDEVTPFAARTAIAKKWGSSLWYNMYYSDNLGDYEHAVWSHALGGGRINYHPLYPGFEPGEREMGLLKGDLMLAECRVRLLNYISNSPLDCPVAVVFGHASAMNWAGPGYADVGMALVDSLWASGIPTDLIPSSEIMHMKLDSDGWICYGSQKYAAVVLYYPEFENESTARLIQRAAYSKTRMMRQGDWTMDFSGNDFDGNAALPGSMTAHASKSEVIKEIHKTLKQQNISLQGKASDKMEKFGYVSNIPPATGFCRLTDGTLIQVAGTENLGGDPIVGVKEIQGQEVYFDALGVAAVRLDKKGRPEAIAAGGLKKFKTGDMEIKLDKRVDMALWKNKNGEWEGVVQELEGEIPDSLLKLTDSWIRLSIPEKYVEVKKY